MLPIVDVVGVGLNATDTLVLLDEYPAYAGKVPFAEEILSPGGQVASAIVACAKWGLRTKYIGTVGDDLRGQIQRDSLDGTGVDTASVITRPGCANQTAYILVDKRTGERTVLWQRPSGLRLLPSDLNQSDFSSCRMLHIDGCDVEAASWAAEVARHNGVPVSLDVDTVYPNFESVLRNVDYLVASSVWPARWTGLTNPFEALQQLSREYGLRVSAMTLGHEGALAYANGQWAYSPGFEVPCVDTTGAGDVFHGAFCFGMLRGMDLASTLEFSNAAAALNCTALGARGHIASLDEISQLRLSGALRHASAEVLQRVRECGMEAATRQ